ncbi:MAG: glycosyltransferase family 2 protein, partial [Pseudomonadota bacterium]
PLGAMESYILKVDRGRVNRTDTALGADYWVERNFNTEKDASIRRYDAARDTVWNGLRADPECVRLHDAAVAWRKIRFDRLMLDDSHRALMGRLLMTPPAQPMTAKAARFLMGYARKPQTKDT